MGTKIIRIESEVRFYGKSYLCIYGWQKYNQNNRVHYIRYTVNCMIMYMVLIYDYLQNNSNTIENVDFDNRLNFLRHTINCNWYWYSWNNGVEKIIPGGTSLTVASWGHRWNIFWNYPPVIISRPPYNNQRPPVIIWWTPINNCKAPVIIWGQETISGG